MIQIGLALIMTVLFLVMYAIGGWVMESEPHPLAMLGIGIILSVVASSCLSMALLQFLNTDPYYLPCEVVATNDYCTYFGTVDSDSREIYAVETGDHIWPDDVPYLLNMDTKCTKDVTDDEVLVVWRTD